LPFAALGQLVLDEPPPRVALLNVAGDQDAGYQATRALRRALLADDQLEPLQPGRLADVLEKALPADPAQDLARMLEEVDGQIAESVDALTNLQESVAQAKLKTAERALISVEPTPEVVTRLAEINFQLGRVYLRTSQPRAADDSFRLVRRLDPSRPDPDPGKFDPDVVDAWKAAKGKQAKSAVVTVTAPFEGAEVYIDGVKVGVTTHEAKVEPGPHYFWASMPEKAPAGERATAIFEEPRRLTLQISRIPDDQIAAELKRGVLTGERADAEIGAVVARVYEMTLVKYVVVVSEQDARMSVAVFSGNGRRLTEWATLTPETAGDVVAALPGRLKLDPNGLPEGTPDAGVIGGGNKKPTGRPWWKDPISYATIGGVSLIVVVSVLILASSDATPQREPNVIWDEDHFQ
jgi:hypothetical protein